MTLPVITVQQERPEKMALGGANEGANQYSRELALWAPPIRSADADLFPDKPISDARGRDMVRNDGYAMGGVAIHKDSIVGAQFLLNSQPAYKLLNSDEVWAEEFQQVVEEKFNLYAESMNCWIDASRHDTFTGMVRLNVGIYVFTGEILSSMEWIRDGIRPYNTAAQIIDTDRLTNPLGTSDTVSLRKGVERNSQGAAIAYHIRSGYPNDPFANMMDSYNWKRIPTRKPWGRQMMIHLYERQRADQTRGIAEMVAVLKQMKMTSRFQDIVLQNAVVNASYAATIESELPTEVVQTSIGGDLPGASAIDFATRYLTSIAEYAQGSRNMQIDGVKIPHLFPGSKLQLRPASTAGGVGTGFEQSLLRHIAASLGLSYEEFSRDFSQTNYSSARAAMNNTWKYMQARKKMIADRWATHVYLCWLEEAIWKKEVPMPNRMTEQDFYVGQNKEAFGRCTWIGASRGQIDETKETEAAAMRVRAGFSTWEIECGKLGYDFREVFRQQQRERKMQADAGFTFDLTGKDVALQGEINADAAENAPPPVNPKPKPKPKGQVNA